MGIMDDISKMAGRERDRIIDSNSRLIDPEERAKISKGELTPYRPEPKERQSYGTHPDDYDHNDTHRPPE